MERTLFYKADTKQLRLIVEGEMIKGTANELLLLALFGDPVRRNFADIRLWKELASGKQCLLATDPEPLHDSALQEAFERLIKGIRYKNTTQLVLVLRYNNR